MDAPFPNDFESAGAYIENFWNYVTIQDEAPPARGSRSDDPDKRREEPKKSDGRTDVYLADGYSYLSQNNRQGTRANPSMEVCRGSVSDVPSQLRNNKNNSKSPPARGSGSGSGRSGSGSDDPSQFRNADGYRSQPYPRDPQAPASGYAYDMSLVDGYSYYSGYNRQMADPTTTQFRNAYGYSSHPYPPCLPVYSHDVSLPDGYSLSSENNRNINMVVTSESVSIEPSQLKNNNNNHHHHHHHHHSKVYCCCFPWG